MEEFNEIKVGFGVMERGELKMTTRWINHKKEILKIMAKMRYKV